jgi:hypothetical protein
LVETTPVKRAPRRRGRHQIPAYSLGLEFLEDRTLLTAGVTIADFTDVWYPKFETALNQAIADQGVIKTIIPAIQKNDVAVALADLFHIDNQLDSALAVAKSTIHAGPSGKPESIIDFLNQLKAKTTGGDPAHPDRVVMDAFNLVDQHDRPVVNDSDLNGGFLRFDLIIKPQAATVASVVDLASSLDNLPLGLKAPKLTLINDATIQVEVVIDNNLPADDGMQFRPLFTSVTYTPALQFANGGIGGDVGKSGVSGDIAGALHYEGTVSVALDYGPAVAFSFKGGSDTRLSDLKSTITSNSSEHHLVLNIGLDGTIKALYFPAFEYKTGFQYDITANSFQREPEHVYYGGVELKDGELPADDGARNQLILAVIKNAAVPLFQQFKQFNVIPDGADKILLGEINVVNNITLRDLLGKTPVQLISTSLGVPFLGDVITTILDASELEHSLENADANSAAMVMAKAEALSVDFPILKKPVQNLKDIWAGKVVDLVTWKIDLAQKFLDSVVADSDLLKRLGGNLDVIKQKFTRQRPDGKTEIFLHADSSEIRNQIKSTIKDAFKGVIGAGLAGALADVIDAVFGPINIDIDTSLLAQISIGVDTQFLRGSGMASIHSLAQSVYLGTGDIFDFSFGFNVGLDGKKQQSISIKDVVGSLLNPITLVKTVLQTLGSFHLDAGVSGSLTVGLVGGADPKRLLISELAGGIAPKLYVSGGLGVHFSAGANFPPLPPVDFTYDKSFSGGTGGAQRPSNPGNPGGPGTPPAPYVNAGVQGGILVIGANLTDHPGTEGLAKHLELQWRASDGYIVLVPSVTLADGTTQADPAVAFDSATITGIDISLLDGDDKIIIDPAIKNRVTGLALAATIRLGSGTSDVRAGSGDATIYGGAGPATIYGGAGSATIFCGRGHDTINGGTGDIAVNWAVGDGAATIHGGTGQGNQILITGGTGPDHLLLGKDGTTGTFQMANSADGASTFDGIQVITFHAGSGQTTFEAGDLHGTGLVAYSADFGASHNQHDFVLLHGSSGNDLITVDNKDVTATVSSSGGSPPTAVSQHVAAASLQAGRETQLAFISNYDNALDTLSILGDGGSDTITVNNWEGTLDLEGQGTADKFTINQVGSGNSLVKVQDFGPGGSNRLIVNGPDAEDHYALTAAAVKLSHADTSEVVQYTGIQRLDVSTQGKSDVIDVQSTAAGVATTVNAGAGHDTVIVSSDAGLNTPPAGNLAGIQGTLTVVGGSGAGNRLIVSDVGNSTTGHTVLVTNSAITGFAPAAINYSTAAGGSFTDGAVDHGDGILLRGSTTAKDVFNIASTLAGSSIKVEGNGLGDVFNVAVAANEATLLVISGGSPHGGDAVNITGSHGSPIAATLTDGSGGGTVTGAGAKANTIRFDTIDHLNIDNSSAGDNITLADGTGKRNDVFVIPEVNGSSVVVNPMLVFTPDVHLANITGDFSVDGGTAKDTLSMLGRNDTGIATTLGHDFPGLAGYIPFAQNGSDDIRVNDQSVTVTNVSLGKLLTTHFQAGTLSKLTVLAGNEAGPFGDTVTVTPSNQLPMFLDGQGPASPASPGDTLILAVPPNADVYAYEMPAGPQFEIDDGTQRTVLRAGSYTNFETLNVQPAHSVTLVGDFGKGTAFGFDPSGPGPFPLPPGASGKPTDDNITVTGTGGRRFVATFPDTPVHFTTPLLNINTYQGDDTVTITPYADNTPSGWGVDVRVDGGSAGANGNRLTVNGAPGVANSLDLVSSGVAGAGQVQDAGVGVVSFANIQAVQVNGNSPADSDRLTFTGTDGADTVNVNLAAAGTRADPLAQLQDSSGTTLLTLANAANFSNLHLNTLGGPDTVNVKTSPGARFNLSLNAGGPQTALAPEDGVGDVLNILPDPAGKPSVRNFQGADGSAGTTLVRFADGSTSRVDYQNVETNTLDDNHRFIRALYQDVLGRSGSAPEWNFWVRTMDTRGSSPGAMAAAIERSPEARGRLVRRWYVDYLGRAPSGGEQQFWVGVMLQGVTEERTLATILASPEYADRANAAIGSALPDLNYVQSLFSQLFHRPASVSEVNAWQQLLGSYSRQDVAGFLLASAEYRTGQVTAYYNDMLHRSGGPTGEEVRAWVFGNLDLRQVRLGFEASQEFADNGLTF